MAEIENSKDLISVLWSGADILRSKMDANEYKDYLLGIVFYKYLSDSFLIKVYDMICDGKPGTLKEALEAYEEVLQSEDGEELKAEMKNNINAFSGNSGVGKSTLINGIFDKDITEEGEISKRNKRGKNTTTSIKLYEIDDNTYIADTPGFSTFDISEIESKNLEKYFREFKENIINCEFVGCTHIKEENCGIKTAIQEGKIDISRYNRFCKIYNELKEREERKW